MTESAVLALTIPEVVRRRAATDSQRTCLVIDGIRELTYGDWVARSSAIAHELVRRGIRPADRVALLLEDADWHDYAIANLGIYLCGATAVGISVRLDRGERLARLQHCGVAALIRAPGIEPVESPFPGWSATVSELAGARSDLPDVPVPPESLLDILYTSGTTGPSKAVAVSHANATFAHTAQGQIFEDIGTILCAVPLGTNAGHNAIMLALIARSTIHVLTSLDPHVVAGTISRCGLELAVLTPASAIALVHSGAHKAYDLSCLTTIMFGSAAVPRGVISQLAQVLPQAEIIIGYGSTESAPGLTALRIDSWNSHQDPGYYRSPATASVGEPRRGTELRIVDADGRPLPPGQLGEICLRSPAPDRWYYGDPDATSRVFRDGWVRMGDLGHVGSDGLLYFYDRASDVITGDESPISSLPAESALYWHPAVAEAAVFALFDPVAGERVAAAVRLAMPVTEAELLDFVAQRVEPDAVPVQIFIVDELPHGIIGKVLKRELRDQFSGPRPPAGSAVPARQHDGGADPAEAEAVG